MIGRAFFPIALLALAVWVVAGAAACAGPSPVDLTPYLGDWQRVSGGEPDQAFTLLIEPRDGAATVTFAEAATGVQTSVEAAPREDHLAAELPAGTAFLGGATGVQLSLDQDGQLVVDKVLADGTTEPVWIYARPVANTTAATPGS